MRQIIKKIIIFLWIGSLSIMSIFFVPTRLYEEHVYLNDGTSYKMATAYSNTNINNLNYCKFNKFTLTSLSAKTQELNVSAYLVSVVAITLVFASMYSFVCIFDAIHKRRAIRMTGPNNETEKESI